MEGLRISGTACCIACLGYGDVAPGSPGGMNIANSLLGYKDQTAHGG